MRKFSAHRIYPVSGPPIAFGIIETDSDGKILNIRDTGGKPVEEAGLEFYPGIIIPGMVNAHCHLEFSFLGGLIPKLTGITGFIQAISKNRSTDPERINKAAARADLKMFREGVSGAGDISNSAITLSVKQKSSIKYHTFIEVFGLDQAVTTAGFDQALRIAHEFDNAGLTCSITPHAPYSVGMDLWGQLSRERTRTGRISIHHDESRAERELLVNRTGIMADHFRNLGFDLSLLADEASDIFMLLGKYLPESDWILVHNTVTDPLTPGIGDRERVFWVLCPRSNLYIENKIPDIVRFAKSGLTICLGTDSLASNHGLSVLDEMKTILEYAPRLSFDTVLKWATINGAAALGMDNMLGTIEPGKNPGLVNIPLFDWKNNKLRVDSRSARLI